MIHAFFKEGRTLSNFIAGIDIGTSKIRAVIGEVTDEGVFQITGVGTSPSTGLRKGNVVNIEATVRAVSQAVEAAEMMSGVEIQHCTIGVGGAHIEALNSRGSVALPQKKENYEIQQEDIARVIDVARACRFPLDRQVIHVIPRSYIVDGEEGIKDPRNRIGVRLEAEVHIITGSVTSVQTVLKCVNRAGLFVDEYMLNSLASVKSIMTEDEKELGSVLIDIGAGTTDIIVMSGGAPVLTAVLPVGGEHVTNDISIVEGLSVEMSEKIKCEAGYCWAPLIEEDSDIILPGIGGRPPVKIPKTTICSVIQPRMEEIFSMVKEKIAPVTEVCSLSGNFVLTGGGANLAGVVELACDVFGTQNVRIGFPGTFGGVVGEYRSPEYSSVIGLVLNAYERFVRAQPETFAKDAPSGSVLTLVKNWFKEFF